MTAQPAPDTIFNESMEAAIAMLLQTVPPNELEIKRLEREATKLAKIDPSGAMEVRAYIAAARADLDAANELFAKALLISNDFRGTVVRNLMLLAHTGQSERVMDVFGQHHDAIRSDPAALRTASQLLGYTGWLMTAKKVDDELLRMGVKTLTVSDGDVEEPTTIDTRGFTELDFAKAIGFAHRFLRSKGARPRATRPRAIAYEDGRSAILFELMLEKSPQELSELEWELFGAMSEAAFPAEEQGMLVLALGTNQAVIDADSVH